MNSSHVTILWLNAYCSVSKRPLVAQEHLTYVYLHAKLWYNVMLRKHLKDCDVCNEDGGKHMKEGTGV